MTDFMALSESLFLHRRQLRPEGGRPTLDISPASLRATREADQRMSPDDWASSYASRPADALFSPARPPRPAHFLLVDES